LAWISGKGIGFWNFELSLNEFELDGVCDISVNQSSIAVGHANGDISVWDLYRGACVGHFSSHSKAIL